MALSSYLAQPDLNLLRINGRICDVRVLVQKDRDGAWHVTGVAVRAGAAGRVISNLHGGGRSLRLERLLKEALGADEEKGAGCRRRSRIWPFGLPRCLSAPRFVWVSWVWIWA